MSLPVLRGCHKAVLQSRAIVELILRLGWSQGSHSFPLLAGTYIQRDDTGGFISAMWPSLWTYSSIPERTRPNQESFPRIFENDLKKEGHSITEGKIHAVRLENCWRLHFPYCWGDVITTEGKKRVEATYDKNQSKRLGLFKSPVTIILETSFYPFNYVKHPSPLVSFGYIFTCV